MLVAIPFPMDAEYDFNVGGGLGGAGAVDVTIDGEKVDVRNPRNFRLAVKAGPHTIARRLWTGKDRPALTRHIRIFELTAPSRRVAASTVW